MSRRFPRIKNTRNIIARGYHNTLEDDGFELITTSGPAVPTLPTTVGVLSVVSSSASDTAGATKKVIVDYLDTDWQEQRALFLIDGTTGVVLDENEDEISAIRVNRAWCNFANVGRIDVKIGSTVMQEIPIGHQTSSSMIYTVPVGQQAVIHGIYGSTSEKCAVRLRQHVHGEGQTFRTIWTYNGIGGFYVPFEYPLRIETQEADDDWAETKVTLIADANCLTASVTAHVELGLYLEVSRSDTTSPGFRY